MSRLPDLASLRLLVEVAHLGSIGAAGRALGISQQSASERIRAVENQTGLTLIERGASGSRLTPSGRLLVEWATRLLAHADEVEHALETLREQASSELRVVASMTNAEHLLPRLLVQLRRQRRVVVHLTATNSAGVLTALREDAADVGFIEGPADLAGLARRVIGTDELVLLAGPDDPWARRRRPLSPAEIAGRALTSREAGSGTRGVVEAALRAAGEELAPPETELSTTSALLGSLYAGSPPAFVSRRAAQRDLDLGALVAVPTTGLDLRRDLTAVWVGNPRPPAGPLRDLLAIATG